MKIVMQFNELIFPPKLTMSIFRGVHYRQSKMDHDVYRGELYKAFQEQCNRDIPIDYPIDLEVLFVDPCSPDIVNVLMALYRALDQKAWKGKKAVLSDDGLIQKVTASKFYPCGPSKYEHRVP
jgi:Holliday junction resolvase RusA-like endonuclease